MSPFYNKKFNYCPKKHLLPSNSKPYPILYKENQEIQQLPILVVELNDMKSDLRNLTHMMVTEMRRFEGQSPPSIVQDSGSNPGIPQNKLSSRTRIFQLPLFRLTSHNSCKILFILRFPDLKKKSQSILIKKSKRKSMSLRDNLSR